MNSRKVKVRAFTTDDGQVDFEVDGVKAKHAKLILAKDSGKHAIDFDLQDQTENGFRFDTSDPIWIDENGPCPPSPGISTDQLSVTSCSADRLSTVNLNDGPARELRYQLNLVAKDGSKARCDPIITNGGGTGT